MNGMFSYENPIMQLLIKLGGCIYLNILWLICSLPIFTIGASTTALYSVTLKLVRNTEGNLTSGFFTAFKSDFRKSTVLWLIMLLIGIILGVDGYVFSRMRLENIFWTILAAVFFAAVLVYGIVLIYVFPLHSYFENTIFATIKNAFVIAIRYFFNTILVFCIHAVFFFLILTYPPLIFAGISYCAFFCSYLFSQVFAACEQKNHRKDDHDA